MTDYRLTPEQRTENVRAVASTAASAIRFMNHATLSPGDAALESPADVDAVLADLAAVAHGMPQLLDQLGRWLAAEAKAGRLEVTSGNLTRNPGLAVSLAVVSLDAAGAQFRAAGKSLDAARRITATLAPAGNKEEES